MKKILCALLGLILTLPGFAACPSGQVEQTYTSATGTVTQNGTPTPDNPIEPVFYQQGNMILRKVGDIADSYDATTGKITRRVGVKALNGTEDWRAHTTNGVFYVEAFFPYDIPEQAINPVSTHYTGVPRTTSISGMPNKSIKTGTASGPKIVLIKDTSIADVNSLISFLSQNLVTVWYPLPESNYYTEDWAAEQCTSSSSLIKIATTAYNSARFSPVVTELNSTIATIRSVVTNTINQTKAIADLQATKQTRPNENCPAGKKCLLVEDNDGQPHWYEIIENAYGLPNGYTALEYIQGDKSAYIKSGITLDNNSSVEAKFQFPNTEGSNTGNFICGARNSGPQNAFTLVGFSGGSYWASNYNNSGDTFGHADTNIHIIKRDKEKVYFDGSLVLTSTSATFTTPGEAYVFSINQGGAPFLTSNIKLWYLKMWDNGTLVRDFVPAKRISDNVVGMYDTVSGTFFTNAGTGTFTAGPEI